MTYGFQRHWLREDNYPIRYDGDTTYQIICCAITRKICRQPSKDCAKCAIARKNGFPVIKK